MTRIDFHSGVSDQLNYTCRLTRKAHTAGNKIIVIHQNQQQLEDFDQMLWQFSPTDFLPHVAIDHELAEQTPILLSLGNHATTSGEQSPNTILINLSDQIPKDYSNFERVIEIVPNEESATRSGRQRYRQYQQLGCTLNHINAK